MNDDEKRLIIAALVRYADYLSDTSPCHTLVAKIRESMEVKLTDAKTAYELRIFSQGYLRSFGHGYLREDDAD